MDESAPTPVPAGVLQLSELEVRVLGVLVEKELTVPDSYPLTLNALVSGCNQKSSRDPVMTLTEAQVKEALDDLRHRSLIMESSGGRAWRYAHNVSRGLSLGSAEVALITALWLRGPQTSGELRIGAERFYRFADLSSVEAYLEEMSTRAPLKVVRLPRQSGAREARWMHLYCGMPDMSASAASAPAGEPELREPINQRVQALEERVARLEEQLAALRSDP